jgi:hypothetical protein
MLCRAIRSHLGAEKHLPDHQKSILPSRLGGTAGGRKYSQANIVFKFAQDVELKNGDYIYGGSVADQVPVLGLLRPVSE